MSTKKLDITNYNFNYVRNGIEYLIHTYQINAEKWAIDLFNKIPLSSTQESIAELENWIRNYLPLPAYNKIRTIIETSELAKMQCIFLSTGTIEQLEETGRNQGIKSLESVIRVLLLNNKD